MKKLLHLFSLVMAFVVMAFCPTKLWAQDCSGNHTFDDYHDPDHTVCTVCGHSFIYFTTATSIGGDDGQIEGLNEEKLADRPDFTPSVDEEEYKYSDDYICKEDNTTKDDEKGMYVTELDYTLTELPVNSFRRSNVVKVILPNSIKEIGCGSFFDCKFLEEITFGNSLKEIVQTDLNDKNEDYYYNKGMLDPFYNSKGHTKNFRSVPSIPMPYYNLSFELTDQSYITDGDGNQADCTVRYASYKRKMPNKWGTIILPLKIYEDSEDYDLYDYKGYDSEKNELTLERLSSYYFNDFDYIKGHCVLIRMSENAKNETEGMYDLDIKKSIVQPDNDGRILSVEISDNESFDGLKLTGTYSQKELKSGYIIANNAFWNVESLKANDALWKDSEERKVFCQPMRGYLEISSSNNAAPSRLSIGSENVGNTTAIEILEAITEGKAEYFDMNGLRIDDLKQGLNVVKRGNKTYKVIIK